MLFADRLMIGTANFGKEYRGHQVPVDEIKRILDYCQCSGIHWLDTAEAYGCDNIIEKHVNSYFDIQYKTIEDPVPQWATRKISHTGKIIGEGVSLYEPVENVMHNYPICQIPYSIVDRRWEKHFTHLTKYQARSIFCGGKVFNSCHSTFSRIRHMARTHKMSPGTLCIMFCLLNPNIDKVVIGVNSYAELKDNLRFFHRLDGFQINDLDVIDLRRHHVTSKSKRTESSTESSTETNRINYDN